MLTNKKQRLILQGVLQDQRRLAEMDWNALNHLSRTERGRHRLWIRQAIEGYVPMNLIGWIGHPPTPSECVMFHREYQRLEAMGLIKRHNFFGGKRTSHLQLTPLGRNVAFTTLDDYERSEKQKVDDDIAIDCEGFDFLPIE